MAWYDDLAKTTFVGTYANEKQFRWDLDAATRRGWKVDPSAGSELEPVIGELPKSKIRVTFVRQEDWLNNRKREIADSLLDSAVRAADEKDARHGRAADELAHDEEIFYSRIEQVTNVGDAGREQAEKDLLSSLKDVISRRRTALRAKDDAIREMDTAVVIGAAEFARPVALLKRARESEFARLDSELALLASQELVAKAAKEWRDAEDRKLAAEEQLKRRAAESETRAQALAARAQHRDELLAAVRPVAR